ncbi:MAG: O-antigen ligase family protein [Jatrophihabitantaceae bacterium]
MVELVHQPAAAEPATETQPATGAWPAAEVAGEPTARAADIRQQLLAAVLLTGLAGAGYAQGAFYPRGQAFLAVLLLVAGALALTIRPIGRVPLSRALPVAALAGWPVLSGLPHGQPGAGLRLSLLVLAVAYTIGCARRLTGSSARLLLDGLLALGGVLALLGWYGVLRHHPPLAIEGQGLYRAASTLSYPNAAGVLLAMLAVLGLALAIGQPAGRRFGLPGAVLTVLLIGLAATMSRGALLALAAGLLVLLIGLGARRVLGGLAYPLVGAALGTAAVLPAAPAGSTPQVAPALAGLLLGVAVGSLRPTVSSTDRPDGRWLLLPYAGLAGGCLAVALLHPFAGIGRARLTVDSPDRWAVWRAAWQVFRAHPLTGAGPRLSTLSWHPAAGGSQIFGYAHNEYLQVLAQFGLLGLGLLVAGLLSLAALLRRHWPPAQLGIPNRAVPAAAAAMITVLLVSSALDFTGHFPALVLTAAAVAGCAVPDLPARP